jgi:hypothetical protein
MSIPNGGKTTTILNIIARADPVFEEIICVHCDPEHTKEYDDVDCTMLNAIPSPEEFEGKVKTLCIIDDIDLSQIDKVQKKNLDRLFGYVSTHKNVSVMITSQDAINIPTCARRCANIFVLWRITDMDSASRVARKTGIKSREFNSIFDGLDIKDHSSLWIDLTRKSPYPLRKDGYQMITRIAGSDSIRDKQKEDSFSCNIEN